MGLLVIVVVGASLFYYVCLVYCYLSRLRGVSESKERWFGGSGCFVGLGYGISTFPGRFGVLGPWKVMFAFSFQCASYLFLSECFSEWSRFPLSILRPGELWNRK